MVLVHRRQKQSVDDNRILPGGPGKTAPWQSETALAISRWTGIGIEDMVPRTVVLFAPPSGTKVGGTTKTWIQGRVDSRNEWVRGSSEKI